MELYVDVSKDLYEAEQEILKVLPKMAKAANFEELRDGSPSAFHLHYREQKKS